MVARDAKKRPWAFLHLGNMRKQAQRVQPTQALHS